MIRILIASLGLSGCAGWSGGYVHTSNPQKVINEDTEIDHIGGGPYFKLGEFTELHFWLGPRWTNGDADLGASVLVIAKKRRQRDISVNH